MQFICFFLINVKEKWGVVEWCHQLCFNLGYEVQLFSCSYKCNFSLKYSFSYPTSKTKGDKKDIKSLIQQQGKNVLVGREVGLALVGGVWGLCLHFGSSFAKKKKVAKGGGL